MNKYKKTFINYYKTIKNKCEKEIIKYNLILGQTTENKILKDALNKFIYLNSDGKFLRGTLVALGYQTLKKDDNYIPLALAIEIFQTSILIHDDIIDKAVKRRGKDTIPVLYKKENEKASKKIDHFANSMALCIGDLGFFLANQLILENYKTSSHLNKVFSYYNDMVIKTINGELLDVFLPYQEEHGKHAENLEKQIMRIYTLKTAWYSVIGPFCLGLTLAGAEKEKIDEFEKILLDGGIAFQIKDDLLGVYGDENTTGKTASDIKEFKQTLLYSYTLKTKYKDDLLKYYGTDNTLLVQDIFIKSGAKKYAEEVMNEKFEQATEKINNLEICNETKEILLGFINYLQNREK